MQQNKLNVLWAKKAKIKDSGKWLPLRAHLGDVAEIARFIWDSWVGGKVRTQLMAGIAIQGIESLHDNPFLINRYSEIMRQLFVFLAFAHDLGKASPAFQCKTTDSIDIVDITIYQLWHTAGV